MYKQLPMIQVNQVNAPWVKDYKVLFTRPSNGKYAFSYIYRTPLIKALAKIMKGDTVIGYYCYDCWNRKFAMESEVIRKGLRAKQLSSFNLKLSADNKLLHDPEGDILGPDVPIEVLFAPYESEGYRLYYHSRENVVVLQNIKTDKYLEFTAQNAQDHWFLRCCRGNLIDFSKIYMNHVTGSISRITNIDGRKEFIRDILGYVKKSEAKTTTLEEDEKEKFEFYWSNRHNFVNNYRHGCSEDSEDAYHTLKYLAERYKKYGKKWDINGLSPEYFCK